MINKIEEIEINDGNVILPNHQLEVFESFFQFGDIKKAKYVFVGLEEGLASDSIHRSIETRLNFIAKYEKSVGYINNETKDYKEGWYIKDIGDMTWSEYQYKCEHDGYEKSFEEFSSEGAFDLTMRMQVRLTKLLDTDLTESNYERIKNEDTKKYRDFGIHSSKRKTAMFDWYPLPNRSSNEFPYLIRGNINTKKKYRAYYDNIDAIRKELRKKIYDNCSMEISIVYAGIQNKKFKLRKAYEEDLDFKFAKFSTGEVHEDYISIISPSIKPKDFLIGKRKEKNQYVIITPFLGMGCLRYADLAVIVSWVKGIMARGDIWEYINNQRL